MPALDCFVISPSETLIKETDKEEAAEGFWPVPHCCWLLVADRREAQNSLRAAFHYPELTACPELFVTKYTRCTQQVWHRFFAEYKRNRDFSSVSFFISA
jgi:hypothetical protein